MLPSVLDIDGLIDLVRQDHAFTPARSVGSVARLERREGMHLPQDMLRFYSEFDGVRLFGNEYILLDPDGILPFDTVIRAVQESGPYMPDSWVSFCRTRDADWIAIDLAPSPSGEHAVAVFHHTRDGDVPALEVVAPSFSCFLALALVSRRHPYWLDLRHPPGLGSAS